MGTSYTQLVELRRTLVTEIRKVEDTIIAVGEISEPIDLFFARTWLDRLRRALVRCEATLGTFMN